MKNLLIRNLDARKLLLLFILMNVVYAAMLTVTIPMVTAHAGGMKLLDVMPAGYDHEYVNALAGALGPDGRSAYLFRQVPLDLIYPFLFAVTCSLLFAFILKKLGKLNSPWFRFSSVPVPAAGFD